MKLLLLFFSSFLISIPALATITIVSISGDSAQDLSTPTSPVVFGGLVVDGGGTPRCNGDGTSVCDSCTGDLLSGSGLRSCNRKMVYPNLRLVFNLASTTTGGVANDVFVKVDGNNYTPTIFPVVGGDGSIILQLTWGELCNKAGAGGQNCTANASFDLTMGYNLAGGTTDEITVKVRLKVGVAGGTDDRYTECTPPDVSGTVNQGFCYFNAFPGDEKIYAENLGVPEGYPTSTGGVEFTNLVFLYEKQLSTDANDMATLERVTNASPYASLAVTKAASPPTTDNRITGLTNGERYCVVMANQDATGIISNFSPISPSSDTSQYCVSPSKVIGLLDDKSCFIATAAFGSDMAPEVQAFREFRNQILLSHPLGERFVKLYYKHSPYFANLISKNEAAKFWVRVVLWPLLILSKLVVSLGILGTLLALFSSLVTTMILFRVLNRPSARGAL